MFEDSHQLQGIGRMSSPFSQITESSVLLLCSLLTLTLTPLLMFGEVDVKNSLYFKLLSKNTFHILKFLTFHSWSENWKRKIGTLFGPGHKGWFRRITFVWDCRFLAGEKSFFNPIYDTLSICPMSGSKDRYSIPYYKIIHGIRYSLQCWSWNWLKATHASSKIFNAAFLNMLDHVSLDQLWKYNFHGEKKKSFLPCFVSSSSSRAGKL